MRSCNNLQHMRHIVAQSMHVSLSAKIYFITLGVVYNNRTN